MRPELVEFDVGQKKASWSTNTQATHGRKTWKFFDCSNSFKGRKDPYHVAQVTNQKGNTSQSISDNLVSVSKEIKTISTPLMLELQNQMLGPPKNDDWLTRAPEVMNPSLLPVPHESPKVSLNEYLWLKKKESSKAVISVLDVYCIPCHTHRFVVEVDVKDGFVCGTNRTIDVLLRNEAKRDPNVGNDTTRLLALPSRYDYQMWQRRDLSSEVFNVEVFSRASGKSVMESMTDVLWNRLTQSILAAHHILRMTRIYWFNPTHSSTIPTSQASNKPSKRILILNYTSDNDAISVTSAAEAMESFQRLSPEDQIIVLKEGLMGIVFIFTSYLYDPNTDSYVWKALTVRTLS